MVNSMIQAYPDKLAVIEHHVYDDWATPETQARLDFYAAISPLIPLLAYDGTIDGWPISEYEAKFLARESVETDVTIELGGEHIAGSLYRITARVAIEPDGRTRQLLINFVQVLDHWPSAASYFRNTYKQAAEPELILLSPGGSAIVEAEIELDADSLAQLADVKIIVWAQDDKGAGPAEVHQAAKMNWPFAPLNTLCGDLDDDDNVGLSDYWLLLDAFATTSGDPRFLPAADLNADGMISWPDYSMWVGCYREANGREFDPNDPTNSDGPSWQPDEEETPLLKPTPGVATPATAERKTGVGRAAVLRVRD